MRRRYLCGALVGVLATAGALTASAAAPPASSHAHAKVSVMRPLGFKPVHHAKPARRVRTNNLTYQGGSPTVRPDHRRRDRTEGVPRPLGLAVEHGQRPLG